MCSTIRRIASLSYDSNSEIVKYENLFKGEFSDKCTSNIENTLIGKQVWIGNNAQILRGVTIGDGAVVSPGSVVVDDVEPYTIVSGIPANKIGIIPEEKRKNLPQFTGIKDVITFYAENGVVRAGDDILLKLVTG